MGAQGGGRQPRNLLVESGLRLRMADVVAGDPIAAETCRRGLITWANSHTGAGSGAAAFQVEAWTSSGSMRLRLALPSRNGEPATVQVQTIALVSRVQPAGGLRWFFVCPRTGRPCLALHCPPGARAFAGRRAWRFSYASQRRSSRDKPLERARAIRLALGGSLNLLDPFPERPAGMWRRTYERQRARAEDASRASALLYAAALDRWAPGWRERDQAT